MEDPLSNLGFTENVGRWSNVMNEEVQYYAYFGSYYIYFSNDAFVFGKEVELSPKEAHERHEKMEHGEEVEPIPWTYFKIAFEDANQNATVLATALKSHTVNFQDELNAGFTIKSRAFDTLRIENIYSNIDVEFYFHAEGGLKYNFIVHPGGDYTDIVMNYEGVTPEKTATGSLVWEKDGDSFNDLAPTSFVREKSVETRFLLKNNRIQFEVENYDLTKALIIDPWITLTLFGASVLEVSTDKFGHCVALPNGKVLFYNNLGILLWTSDLIYSPSDVTVNPSTGDIYIQLTTSSQIIKLDTNGVLMDEQVLIEEGAIKELWRIKYNEFNDKLCLGEGGLLGPENQVSILSSDLMTYDIFGPLPNPLSLVEDCALFDLDPVDGSFYFLASGYTYLEGPSDQIYGNRLFKLNNADPNIVEWGTYTGCNFQELLNTTYTLNNNGVNGIACGRNYVYTYNGNKILQIDKFTGSIIDSLFLDAVPFSQYGIDTDNCGKLYVGSDDTIFIFSENLDRIGEYIVPGTCYDLVINGRYLNVGGAGFVAQFNLESLNEGEFEVTSTNVICSPCSGTISITPTVEAGPLSFTIEGETNDTGIFTDLCEGTYDIMIEDSLGCTYYYMVTIDLDSTLNLSVVTSNSPTCYGFTDGSITVEAVGDDITYTWVPENPIEGATFNTIGAGTYIVYAASGEEGCVDSLVIELTQPDSLFADLSLTNPLCFGDTTGYVVVDSVYNAQGDLGNISYVWSPDPPGISGVGADSLYNLSAGNYLLTMTDDRGCSWVKEFSITTPEPITFSEFGFDPAFCRLYEYQSGNGVLFAAAIGGTPDYDYLWENLDNGETSFNSTWGGLNPGNYRITVTDANGCVLTQTLFLDSLNPIAAFSVNSAQLDASLEGTELVIANFINESSNFSNPNDPFADTTFFWNLNHPQADWFISDDFFELIDTSYVGEAIYEVCLVALNKNGCSDTACQKIIVHVQPKFMAPNVFSPDGDGINDGFSFEFKSLGIETFSCVILNRWGIKVAEFNHVTDAWNGRDLQGDECTDGVYFYTYKAISTNQTIFEGQGNVQLLRNGN
ncbi:MAG: gliding motility-associated C-terminal domain-containing protein [Crocinitomix sp.]|nr:gliding motility-associated C-terminal domain-containing protein [Crocinitomix sp.]